MTLASTETTVVLPTALSTALAACCGVSGGVGSLDAGCLALPSPVGSSNLVTEFWVEFQSQAVEPFLMTSISDSGCGIASRKCLASW